MPTISRPARTEASLQRSSDLETVEERGPSRARSARQERGCLIRAAGERDPNKAGRQVKRAKAGLPRRRKHP